MAAVSGRSSNRCSIPVRVLFNTYPVAFDCPGGGEIQLLQSRAALQRAGIEVLLFDPWRPQFDEVDIVHYFSTMGGSSCFCEHVKNKGLPLLISPILWLTEENKPLLPLGEIGGLLQRCDLALPNSRAEADQLAKQFGLSRNKFAVTHNAIDPAFGESVDTRLFRQHFGIEGEFLLNVANIEPRKNQQRLAQAVRELGMDLIVLGRVRDQDYLVECQAAAGGRLRYLGPVEHGGQLLRSAYQACTAFVLPSLLETPGLAALEAAASGAHLVVTRTGSAPEYFAELATYVNPLDVADIRGGIEAALAKPRTASLRRHIIEQFTWDRTARQLIQAYECVLGTPAENASRA